MSAPQPPPRKSTLPQHSPPSRLVLSTDPPYYDNIGYADLSDFFYIWLRRSLREVYPDIFDTMLVPKADELIASRHRHGGKAEAKDFFESGMAQAFAHFRSFVSHDYPQTVYYAFKQQDAGFMNAFGLDPFWWTLNLSNAPAHIASGWQSPTTNAVCGGCTKLLCSMR